MVKEKDPSINQATREIVLDKIEPMVHHFVFNTLKANYGEERSQWWFKL